MRARCIVAAVERSTHGVNHVALERDDIQPTGMDIKRTSRYRCSGVLIPLLARTSSSAHLELVLSRQPANRSGDDRQRCLGDHGSVHFPRDIAIPSPDIRPESPLSTNTERTSPADAGFHIGFAGAGDEVFWLARSPVPAPDSWLPSCFRGLLGRLANRESLLTQKCPRRRTLLQNQEPSSSAWAGLKAFPFLAARSLQAQRGLHFLWGAGTFLLGSNRSFPAGRLSDKWHSPHSSYKSHQSYMHWA